MSQYFVALAFCFGHVRFVHSLRYTQRALNYLGLAQYWGMRETYCQHVRKDTKSSCKIILLASTPFKDSYCIGYASRLRVAWHTVSDFKAPHHIKF